MEPTKAEVDGSCGSGDGGDGSNGGGSGCDKDESMGWGGNGFVGRQVTSGKMESNLDMRAYIEAEITDTAIEVIKRVRSSELFSDAFSDGWVGQFHTYQPPLPSTTSQTPAHQPYPLPPLKKKQKHGLERVLLV